VERLLDHGDINPKKRSGWHRSGSLSPGQKDHATTVAWQGELNKIGKVQTLVEAFCIPIPNNCPPKIGRPQPATHIDTRPPTTAPIKDIINSSIATLGLS
jgi:hypothetical protein